MTAFQTCKKCGVAKAIDEFSRNASMTSGRESSCRMCRYKQYKQWAASRPRDQRAYKRHYDEMHRDELNAKARERYARNRDEQRARARKYSREHSESERERHKRWRRENPEKAKEVRRRYKEKLRRRKRENAIENPRLFRRAAQTSNKRWRERRKAAPGYGYTTKALIRQRWNLYGGKCYYCHVADAGHMDHRIPLSRGGTHWPANLVPACKRCNTRKHAKTETEFFAVLLAAQQSH